MIEKLQTQGWVGWHDRHASFQEIMEEGKPIVIHRFKPRIGNGELWQEATITIEIEGRKING